MVRSGGERKQTEEKTENRKVERDGERPTERARKKTEKGNSEKGTDRRQNLRDQTWLNRLEGDVVVDDVDDVEDAVERGFDS